MSSPFDSALNIALRRLARRDLLEAELRRDLGAFEPDVIDSVLNHLRAKGILSEDRAIRAYVLARSGRRARSSRLVEQELAAKGADPIKVTRGLNPRSDDDQMLSALSARFQRTPDQRGKAWRFLVARGFEPDDAESLVNRYFEPAQEFLP